MNEWNEFERMNKGVEIQNPKSKWMLKILHFLLFGFVLDTNFTSCFMSFMNLRGSKNEYQSEFESSRKPITWLWLIWYTLTQPLIAAIAYYRALLVQKQLNVSSTTTSVTVASGSDIYVKMSWITYNRRSKNIAHWCTGSCWWGLLFFHLSLTFWFFPKLWFYNGTARKEESVTFGKLSISSYLWIKLYL